MRIFTLGKNGIPLFFFALFLLTGTYSSYGQCPTVASEDSTQYFCDSQEAEISSLTVTTGTNVVWYASQTSTTPLPETQFLVNGTTYYAGQADNSCVGQRAAVTVRVASEPEILGIKASTAPNTSANRKQSLAVIGVCVADVNNPGLTIDDLRTNAQDENNVRWYLSRTATTPLAPGTPLQNNTDYFASVFSVEGNCETNRRKTTVRFFSEAAPTGPASQEFCAIDSPTLGDIEATGDNRYFSTSTSQTELSSNTPLVDGRTYYVSAVGADCESVDRLAVTVTVIPPADLGTPEPGIVCELDVQETFPSVDAIEDYLLALLGEGVPTDGTFNPTPTQLASQYQNDADGLGDFTTTYTVGCDQVDLTISIIPSEDANAGEDVTVTYQITDGPQNLFGEILNGQTIGTFAGYPDGMFDPSSEGAGTYTITYTVDETSGCIVGSDSAVFTITVAPCEANAGADTNANFCRSEAEALAAQIFAAQTPEERNAILASALGDRDTDGTFTGDPAMELYTKYTAGIYPFSVSTTYVVGEGVCEDQAAITISVYEDVNAGEDASITLNVDDAPVNLFTLLGENAQEGGTWNMGNGMFNPATDAPGTYTYTVGEGCTDTASVVVSVTTDPTDPTDPVVTPGYAIVCEADVQTFFPSVDEIRKFYLRLLPAGVPTNGTLNPTAAQLAQMYQADADGLGAFTTVYTAPNGQTYELTVNIVTEAEAGESNTVTLTTEDEPVNLFEYLGEDALQGGTWSSGNGMFDPATDEPGTFTYTVGYEGCMDSAAITVIVNEPTDPTDPCDLIAGNNRYGVVCLSDVPTTFPSVDEIRKYYIALLGQGVPTNGTLSPTAAQLAAMYRADADGMGEFSTTYTVTVGECTDSVVITVLITDQANAGEDATIEVDADGEPVDLFAELGPNAQRGGTWSSGNGIFDPATDEAGTFTYTVGSGDCMDSATVTVTVTTDPTECEGIVDAGEDNSVILCNSEVRTLNNNGVRNLYLGLLEAGVDRTGTFNPTIQQLIDQYNFQSNYGDFVTVYTVVNGDCQDSVQLTVTVLENLLAGENATVNLEEGTTATVDLFARLGGTPAAGGTWTFGGEEVDGTFDPATDQEGAYTYTVTSENGCEDSAVVTVVVGTQEPNCPEVTETEQTFCGGTPTVADLLPAGVLWFSSADATQSLAATTALVDGTIYFAGDVEGTCDNRPSVTVTLSTIPAAPTVADFDGCVADGATVADLDITGDEGSTFTVYSDEAMETPVADTEVLTEGTYFVTQTNASGCESTEAAEINVTLSDSDAPTLEAGGNVFCEFDNATIADLQENVTGAGDIIWYATATGTETLSGSTVLVNGTTYYAASTDATSGCESSQRLPVTITLEMCEIVIPEIFTPNGDGINDTFVIRNIGSEYPNHRLEIYNRWSRMVYNGPAGEDTGWDGTSSEGSFGSGVLPVGVYFYILYFNDGQTAPTQGRLYLSR